MTNDFSLVHGWMSEAPVHDLATWYHDECPDTTSLTFEAHLMVLRTYVTLVEQSPLERVAGLSRARYNILRMLYQAPDKRLLMGDFVQGMNVSPTNITKLVDSLVADGLVQRATHELDKRKTWARLTGDGERLVEVALPLVAEHVKSLWGCLEEEEKQVLVHLLAKMRLHWASADAQRPTAVARKYAQLLRGAAPSNA